MERAIYSYNASRNFMQDDNYLWFDYTFNWTQYISGDLGDSYYHCSLSFVQTFRTISYRINLFGSSTDWVIGFIQNLLANVISFQRIYERINSAIRDKNEREIYYQFGRIMNLLLDFYPIE